MVHLIFYIPRNRTGQASQYQIFDQFIDWVFAQMENGGFTFDVQYFEDNYDEIVNAGITDFTQPIMKDAGGNFIAGVDNIKPIIEALSYAQE